MAERVLMSGNEAIASGAIHAGCKAFFGYPITPQSEIPEYMARELPKAGGVFLQSECELAAAGMVYGASYTGTRTMTASSGPGISLMQEFFSFASSQMVPMVIADIMRGGPGSAGTGLYSQADYFQATKSGGHGGYRTIVLAPFSSQECFDFTQVAFHLSEKYRMVVIVLSDGLLGHSSETVDLKTLEFEPLPEKTWALKRVLEGKEWLPVGSGGALFGYPEGIAYYLERNDTYKKLKETEVRYKSYEIDDADVLLVSFGWVARMALEAVRMARSEGLKVGLLRPVTLFPFPTEAIREAAVNAGRVLVVEDSPGLMVEDVEAAVQGKAPVHLLGVWGRNQPGMNGVIQPGRILEEVKGLK